MVAELSLASMAVRQVARLAFGVRLLELVLAIVEEPQSN